MRRAILGLAACVLGLLLAGCGGGGVNDPAPAVATPAGRTVSTSIASAQTGINYTIQIYFPASYDASSAAFPVVYQMDLESRFAPSIQVLQQRGTSAVLVGIGNMGDARRFVDFEMPGAAAYYRFLTLELVPFIESQVRADPRQRILNGHSLSGLMVVYALFMEPPGNRHFASFISEDGSMFEQPDTLRAMEAATYAASHDLPVKLALSADFGGNLSNVLPLCQQINSRAYAGLQMEMLEYGLGHVPMDVHAFGDSLDFLFGVARPPDGTVVSCK